MNDWDKTIESVLYQVSVLSTRYRAIFEEQHSRECGDRSNREIKGRDELNDDKTGAGIVTGIYVDKEQESCLRKRLRIGDVAR